MIVTAFQEGEDGELRRVVVRDLVGGWKMSEEDIEVWTAGTEGRSEGGERERRRGEWRWEEHDPAAGSDAGSMHSNHAGGAGERVRQAVRQTTITPSNPSGQSRFPPDGGYGGSVAAAWSYYPEEGEGGEGELMFPKRAEIREVEVINDEWSEGVYAGERGLVPGVYVRDV